jgi:hypothetical protein
MHENSTQLLAQLSGMVTQISEENSSYILDLICSPGFASNKRLSQLTVTILTGIHCIFVYGETIH